jgi:uncharacterized membrane protein
MVFERAYRQRLEGDLARWQQRGLITPAAGDAIRASLGPMPGGVNVATVVGLVGGLLIAAAFLAFVAANWSAIPRPERFAILLAGIAASYGLGAWFDRSGRAFLADSAVSVGCIVFGGAIALVGQMYHLGGNFSAALLLWAVAALVAAMLTGSRGAYAVALTAACFWSGVRVDQEGGAPHLAFIAFWLIAAMLPVLWNSAVARHLAAIALLAWWVTIGVGPASFIFGDPAFLVGAGVALMFGVGLMLASSPPPAVGAMGITLSNYGALAFALVVAWRVADLFGSRVHEPGPWLVACGVIAVVAALGAATLNRKVAPALAAFSLALGLAVVADWTRPPAGEEAFMGYALALVAMLALVASGMLDDERPRIVAGWIGLAATIAAITWAAQGSLLQRSAFLAAAGLVAVALANLLGRLMPREGAP